MKKLLRIGLLCVAILLLVSNFTAQALAKPMEETKVNSTGALVDDPTLTPKQVKM